MPKYQILIRHSGFFNLQLVESSLYRLFPQPANRLIYIQILKTEHSDVGTVIMQLIIYQEQYYQVRGRYELHYKDIAILSHSFFNNWFDLWSNY
jgi:hypothetical protein